MATERLHRILSSGTGGEGGGGTYLQGGIERTSSLERLAEMWPATARTAVTGWLQTPPRSRPMGCRSENSGLRLWDMFHSSHRHTFSDTAAPYISPRLGYLSGLYLAENTRTYLCTAHSYTRHSRSSSSQSYGIFPLPCTRTLTK